MNFSMFQFLTKGKDVPAICANVNEFDVTDPEMMRYFEILNPIWKKHAVQMNDEIAEAIKCTRIIPNWLSDPIHSGIYRDGKELILSGYYQDESGNRHFTHDQALEIENNTEGWRLPTKEDHEAILDALFDNDKWEWKDNVLGTDMNGLDYLTRYLGYEMGGYRHCVTGALTNVGSYGYSWSSSVSATLALDLHFYQGYLNHGNAEFRASGFQVRCLREY